MNTMWTSKCSAIGLYVALLVATFCTLSNAVSQKDSITSTPNGFRLTLKSPTGSDDVVFSAVLGISKTKISNIDETVASPNKFKIQTEKAELSIKQINDDCYQVTSNSNDTNDDPDIIQFEDCIDLGEDHWYGGPERWNQEWPFEKITFSEYSYISKQSDSQAIAEPYWVNSTGVYVLVDQDVPLFIDQHNHQENGLCLIAKNEAPYPQERTNFSLSYKVCTLPDARAAHEHAVKNYLGKPIDIPDERMIRYPIWSTWARYKSAINTDIVLGFADEINEHGFNNSQIEIDDNWETCYGSAEFDETKFSDVQGLTNTLKEKGFRVTLWIHPFINTNCEPYYTDAINNGHLIKNTDGNYETSWWNGQGGAVDFTKEDTVDWWRDRLKQIQAKGIDSFKFDAGENSWLPQLPVLNGPLELNPQIYTSEYVRAVSYFGSFIEIRSAARTQVLPVFVRMLDKDSRWGLNNGLRSLITTLLEMNTVGYPFVLPDMIGGNAYGSDKTSKELFIRWLQANTFMPSLQFSIVPWDFDDETVEISKKFTTLHDQYSDYIVQLAKKAVEDGSPINPPVWWIDPTDPDAQAIDDEYMLGTSILVAPILDEGATSRDIYLPGGLWKDELHPDNEFIQGRTWLRNYSAALDELPYFTSVQTA